MSFHINTLFTTPVLDLNGAIVPGAILTLYQAGTTTGVSMYANADLTGNLGIQEAADSTGRFPDLYCNEQDLKILVTDADGVTLPGYPIDNIRGFNAIGVNPTLTLTEGDILVYDASAGQFDSNSATLPIKTLFSTGKIAPTVYTLSDDAAVAIDFSEEFDTEITGWISISAAAAGFGRFFVTLGASPAISQLDDPSSIYNFSASASPLSGTTGTDNFINVRASNDGVFYLENRTGAADTFSVMLIGA